MEIGSATFSGASTKDLSDHVGRHRAFSNSKSIGLIPLGDRSRTDVAEYGIGVVEERDSVDRYTRHII